MKLSVDFCVKSEEVMFSSEGSLKQHLFLVQYSGSHTETHLDDTLMILGCSGPSGPAGPSGPSGPPSRFRKILCVLTL